MTEEKNPLILLVEDETEILEIMATLLENTGFSVMRAQNGEDALKQLEKSKPEIIISDIYMPKMDGFEFYTELRNRGMQTPFIFLTGFSDVESVVRGRELGVDDYLIKPVDARLLLSSIRGKLKRAEEIRSSSSEQIAEIKNHIVQVLTHEFRTPLTIINSTTDMLTDASLQFGPDELHQFVTMIKEGGVRLQKLVESFLLASSIEAGETLKEYENCVGEHNLTEIVVSAVTDIAPLAAEHSITIDHQILPGNLTVKVCQKHAHEILCRLLENAVKFGIENSTVNCRISDDGISWMVSIEDNGRGIPTDELPKIAGKFYQVDRKRYEQQGVGLGLYIAKSLVDMNKLVMSFESAVGKGTTVRLRFPKMITL